MITWRAHIYPVIQCDHRGCSEEIDRTDNDMFLDCEGDLYEEANSCGWEPEPPPADITNIQEVQNWYDYAERVKWYCPRHIPSAPRVFWSFDGGEVRYWVDARGRRTSLSVLPPLRPPEGET